VISLAEYIKMVMPKPGPWVMIVSNDVISHSDPWRAGMW